MHDDAPISSKIAALRAPESAPDPLEAIVVLPAQLCWGARSDSQTSGPRALMLALLEDAIRCLVARRRPGRAAREAEAWISSDDLAWPMSFRNVCDTLGFSPERLRAALLTRAADGGTATDAPHAPWKRQVRSGKARTRTIGQTRRQIRRQTRRLAVAS